MTFFRLGILAAAISLSSCTLSTAPEPAEFKLSAEALSKQYPASRKTGAVRLYAHAIQTTKDEWGRETHVASGGAVLVKEAMTPIYALAPDISITPEYSEVRGEATVKKGDRLYIGQNESTTFRIDGAAIKPEGPHVVRGIADEAAAAEAKARKEAKAEAKALAAAEKAKAKEEAKAMADTQKLVAEEEAQAQMDADALALAEANEKAEKARTDKRKAEADLKAVAMAQTQAADEPPAKPKKSPASTTSSAAKKKKPAANSKPNTKIASVTKPSSPEVKPSSPPAADKTTAVPAVDRARLLNLMREPTDR